METLRESIVETIALDWLPELSYEVLSELMIASGETTVERRDCKQVLLFDRLQTKLEELNPNVRESRSLAGLGALLPKLLSGEVRLSAVGIMVEAYA